jgi:hypothetical protein
MANALFVAYRNQVLGSGTRVDLDADTIKAMFVDHADDTPVPATDDFIDDILAAARVPAIASCPTLGSKTIGTVSAGTFDAADAVFPNLSGDQSESLILFKDTGTESSSDLVAFWDTATGLPLTPNGADVTVQWNASGILTIG